MVTGHRSILFPQNEIFKCVSGQFFKSFLVANSLCGPGSASHTFPSFPASAVTKTRGNSLSGGVSGTEQWSTVLRARHLRKFACGPAVSRSATNFRNIRAPQHQANGVCNLCLGEPRVITTVFSTKGCFKRTISLPIRHMPRTNWWPKSVLTFFWQNGCSIAPCWIFERLRGHFYTAAEST